MEIYIAKNKQQMGPYDIGQVTQMLQSGILEKYDLYWYEGMLDWAPVGSLIKQGDEYIGRVTERKVLAEKTKNSYSEFSKHDEITKKIIVASHVCLGICLLSPAALGLLGLYFSTPFAVVSFILGVVILTKGKITEGITSILLSLLCPLLGWGLWAISAAFLHEAFKR